MFNLKMFNTVEDLCKLTGLSENELYDNGFDTDDWDVGFCSDQALTYITKKDKDGVFVPWKKPFEDSRWLVHEMDNYCVGYDCIKYGGKYYYMVHHV